VDSPGARAAVDCGTNSTRLLVVDGAGAVKTREMHITRLGEGVDRTRRLNPEAVARTLDVLRAYRVAMEAQQVRHARLVATSAVRDARDGDAFLRSAGDVVGVDAELLSGEEEGRLSYLGATDGLSDAGGATAVVDIGGGSTELVLKVREAVRSVSLDIGCVRLTERFLRSDPPGDDEVASAHHAIDAELDRAFRVIPELGAIGPGDRLIGLAGTVSTLAMLELGLSSYDRDAIHHFELSRGAVERWCRVLGDESIATRAKREGLPEGRQDVIFGGALVLGAVMRRLRVPECVVSESDILDGLVLSLSPAGSRQHRRPVRPRPPPPGAGSPSGPG
jgi:exopolyphosphatase / guanosine-5'-triphosphate,3'-diphosphate pyrophosphatase